MALAIEAPFLLHQRKVCIFTSGAAYSFLFVSTYAESFIERLAEKNEFARIVNIGKSFEGRDMKVLAIDKVNILSLV